MTMFALTDSPEPRRFLVQQLTFLHDLLYLRMGAGMMNTRSAAVSSPAVTQKLRRTVAYYIALCDVLPSFMVHVRIRGELLLWVGISHVGIFRNWNGWICAIWRPRCGRFHSMH
jgi:hypothetical protein